MFPTRQFPNTRGIGAFFFTAIGAPTTIVGYLVDEQGTNLGSFSKDVPVGSAVNLLGDNYGNDLTIPTDSGRAVGAVLKTSGTVAYAPGESGDLVAHADRYPTLPTTFSGLGEVAA